MNGRSKSGKPSYYIAWGNWSYLGENHLHRTLSYRENTTYLFAKKSNRKKLYSSWSCWRKLRPSKKLQCLTPKRNLHRRGTCHLLKLLVKRNMSSTELVIYWTYVSSVVEVKRVWTRVLLQWLNSCTYIDIELV